MKRYIYIQAYDNNGPCFRHCFVEANSIGEAYEKGSKALGDPPDCSGLNDYAVEIPKHLFRGDDFYYNDPL